jgi:hypothetical protein
LKVEAPRVVAVEAKKQDLNGGLAQCVALGDCSTKI